MTAQTSNQPLEERPVNENVAVSPEEAAALLARIDAILDELYTMRQTVLGWMAAQPYTPAGGVNTVREPVKEFVADTEDTDRVELRRPGADTPSTNKLAVASRWPVKTSGQLDIVSALSGSLGPTSPDEFEYFNTFDLSWERFAK